MIDVTVNLRVCVFRAEKRGAKSPCGDRANVGWRKEERNYEQE